MWSLFALTCFALTAIVILPGYTLAKALNLNQIKTIGFAPLASVAIFAFLGIVFDKLGCKGAIPLLLATTLMTICCMVYVAVSSNKRSNHISFYRRPGRTTVEVVCSVAVCSIAMTALFLANLDTASSFLEFADNITHLNTIASMIDGGSFSTLNASEYSANNEQASPYSASGSFYPAGWHIIVALACYATSALAPLGENAGAFVFSSVIFASGMAALLLQVFPEKKGVAIIGSVVFCACAAFPVAPLDVHQIYPNFAGWCCLPGTVALFKDIVDEDQRHSLTNAFVLSIVIIGLAVLHPNCVISLFIYVAIYFIISPWVKQTAKQNCSTKPLVRSFIMIVVMVAIWALLLDSSLFTNVTSFLWTWTVSATDALSRTLLFGYTYGEPQWLFAIIVYIGVGYCLRDKKIWWIPVAFIVFSAIFFFNASGDPLVKKIFAGYWYTDPERTAACATIAAIPCAAIGLYQIIMRVQQIIAKLSSNLSLRLRPAAANVISLAFLILFTVVCYSPQQPFSTDVSSMGFRTYELNSRSIVQNRAYYTNEEKEFVDEVKSTVPENATVLNLPYDGSILAFSVNDMRNLYYKTLDGSNESEQSKLIRSELCNVATSNDVKNAVESIGAEYVLLLDRGDESQFDSVAWGTPGDPDWQGFQISENTTGFELVLSEGNLRLFKITG